MADIKQAAIWMQDRKSVKRACWPKELRDGASTAASLQADVDEGLVLFRLGSRVFDCGQITIDALLAEDWEIVP